MKDITSAVVDQLTDSCTDCVITSDIIDRRSFTCSSESHTYVTYRARLEGTTETDSGSLISLIEDWVRGGASIIVTGILMRVDPQCSVAISSLSEGECLNVPPITDPTSTSSMATTILVAGVFVVLIVAISVTIVIIVALVLKNRCGLLSIKNTE